MPLSNAERQRLHRAKQKVRPKSRPVTKAKVERNGWQKTDDIIELLESLPRVQVGRNGYEEKDRAADFIATFNTEQGRRVLAQIALICDPASLLTDADKHGTLAFKTGMRRVMNEIQRCFVIRGPVTIERTPDGSNT